MTLKATQTDMKVNIVDRSDPSCKKTWQSSFKASYLEEIARKTGHSKDYSQIIAMLIGALRGSSTSSDETSIQQMAHAGNNKIFVDLLGLKDL